jgi:hypothetical protein
MNLALPSQVALWGGLYGLHPTPFPFSIVFRGPNGAAAGVAAQHSQVFELHPHPHHTLEAPPPLTCKSLVNWLEIRGLMNFFCLQTPLPCSKANA